MTYAITPIAGFPVAPATAFPPVPVRVVNFTGAGFVCSRGTGEQANVITIEILGGGGSKPTVFMTDFVSHSCNYGFFARDDGTFLLVTDSTGTDFEPGRGYYLKFVNVNPSGVATGYVQSSVYASTGAFVTYQYGGFIYAGPIIKISNAHYVLLKIDLVSLAITEVYDDQYFLWRAFDLLPNPENVWIPVAAGPDVVLNLPTGSIVRTVDTNYLIGNHPMSQITQATSGGNWFAIVGSQLFEYDYDTGIAITHYDSVDLFGPDCLIYMIQYVAGELVMFAYQAALEPAQVSYVGVFNVATRVVDGLQSVAGYVSDYNFMLYAPAVFAFYFVATEFDVAARAYGYSLISKTLVYNEVLELDFQVGQQINMGTASFTGSVDSTGNVYLSAFTGNLDVDGIQMEAYKVFKIVPVP